MDPIRNKTTSPAAVRVSIVALAALSVLVGGSAVHAVPPNVEDLPGFVDGSAFSKIADRAPDDTRLVEVCVTRPMLRVLSKSFIAKDASMANMLRKLDAVTAVIIGLGTGQDDLRAEARQEIKSLVAELPTRDWECLAHIREEGQEVYVMVRYDSVEDDEEPGIVGLTVLMNTRGEGDIVFVNICGEIDLANMGLLGTTMSLPGLEFVPSKADKSKRAAGDEESDEDKQDEDDEHGSHGRTDSLESGGGARS
jgi:hypothetical protein